MLYSICILYDLIKIYENICVIKKKIIKIIEILWIIEVFMVRKRCVLVFFYIKIGNGFKCVDKIFNCNVYGVDVCI